MIQFDNWGEQMHILLGLLSAVGIILFALWRINMAVQATRELADAADSARGFFRRSKWRKKLNSDQLKNVSDPREAATIMMVAVAETDGAMTDRERIKILSIMRDKFEASQEQAEEMLSLARWMSKDAGDLTSFLNRLVPVIMKACDEKQKHELVEMLRDVASAHGEVPQEQEQSILQIKRYLAI